ncbi:MAG: hypothetical protein L6262_07975 [Weeksellaceae bacterium]|nr:hypothetical protein [Weeksellaceae bacterium]
MKHFYFLLLFLFFAATINAQESFFKINGSTNVNNFHCVNNKFKIDGSALSFSEKHLPNIILKVTDFDCGNRMMTKDFQKILNAEQYPDLTIKFINFIKTETNFIAIVEVKMMNKSKRYNIEFILQNNKLIGRKNVKFSDFNIIPPKKMGGMIVVKDDLDLTFCLSTKT